MGGRTLYTGYVLRFFSDHMKSPGKVISVVGLTALTVIWAYPKLTPSHLSRRQIEMYNCEIEALQQENRALRFEYHRQRGHNEVLALEVSELRHQMEISQAEIRMWRGEASQVIEIVNAEDESIVDGEAVGGEEPDSPGEEPDY